MIVSKAVYIVIPAIIIIIIASSTYFLTKNNNKIVSPLANLQPTNSAIKNLENEELKSWKDQAEFSISYPGSLNLDPHKEDNENYAHIELTSKENSGSLTVFVKDTNADTLKSFVRINKIQGAIDSTIDGVSAIKLLTDTTPKRIITSTLNKGYLYQIETVLDVNGFWNTVNSIVVSNFKFINSEIINNDKVDSVKNNSENNAVENDNPQEEEIIE
jgi:hypothetical protein